VYIARAKAVFIQACRFVKARESIQRSSGAKHVELDLIYPMLTLEAFAIELFLKSFILQQGIEPPKSHNLGKLFRQLHPNIKRSIVDKWDNGPRKQIEQLGRQQKFPTDLPNALVKCSDGFQELRYAFENPEDIIFYLGALPRLLLEVAADRRPEWID
jgi:HEPN domain